LEVKLKGLYPRPKTLADGTEVVYYYAWRGKGAPRLQSEPGTLEFVQEFQEAQKQRHAPFNDTVSGLIDEYSRSHEFTKLARLTKRDHIAMFAIIEKRFGKMPIEALEDKRVRSDFKRWRDGISSDRQADRAWSSLKRVFSYALDGGRISWNPCAGGGKRYHGDRSECVWTDAQIHAFLQSAPRQLQLPFLFAFHTGQRQGDILRLQWSAWDGSRLRLKQRKTGRNVSILANDALKALIADLPKNSTYMLLNSLGRPWTSSGFSASFRKAQKAASVAGVTFHDLRGTFITRRRGEGSSLEDIADVVGLSTKDISKVLEKHYLGGDETRADAVILRMKL
jgi:integrase